MNTVTIVFARDFTDCPGGRLRMFGDHSGQEFREDHLEPALAKYDRVVVDLDGVIGFPASFIDEAFGRLVEQFGPEELRTRLDLRLTDDPVALQEIRDVMAAHTV